jgi:hypothetical protein
MNLHMEGEDGPGATWQRQLHPISILSAAFIGGKTRRSTLHDRWKH